MASDRKESKTALISLFTALLTDNLKQIVRKPLLFSYFTALLTDNLKTDCPKTALDHAHFISRFLRLIFLKTEKTLQFSAALIFLLLILKE